VRRKAQSGPPNGLERSRPCVGKRERRGGTAGPPSRPSQEGEKGKGADRFLGLAKKEGRIFKIKLFSNSIFSNLSQIQMEFEFNFKTTSPTLNQKQYDST
jgi:hypothetical protein